MVHNELGDLILQRLRRLPSIARLPLESGHEMVITHGSPADPTVSMTADLTDDELITLLGDDPADLVICGGDHVPFQRIVADVRIVGVGSVGEAPVGNVAYATLVTSTPTQTSIEQKEVPLPVKRAANHRALSSCASPRRTASTKAFTSSGSLSPGSAVAFDAARDIDAKRGQRENRVSYIFWV